MLKVGILRVYVRDRVATTEQPISQAGRENTAEQTHQTCRGSAKLNFCTLVMF